MFNNTENPDEGLKDRWDQLSQSIRLAILASVFWPVFSLIYLWEPRHKFYFQAFLSKFISMGVLPLVLFWGTLWVVQGFQKDKTQN